MYNHENQYRCIIIRGKSKTELDNLLPMYAMVIDEICPCEKKNFDIQFNLNFAKILHGKNADENALKKTLDNHRTEIAGKLFGMYYVSNDGVCHASERTKKFIADRDQPAFFKDICYKMQFPNGMNKIQTVESYMELDISLRQFPYIIKTLLIAKECDLTLSVNDIGYYILNNLDVLRGNAEPIEVISQIIKDKNAGINREIKVKGKELSYTMQHIREQLIYLELANLIYITNDKKVVLNMKEKECIDLFAKEYKDKPNFDVYSYDVSKQSGRDSLYNDWNNYYSTISLNSDTFTTKLSALMDFEAENSDKNIPVHKHSTTDLGDEGENFVYNYERTRVSKFDARLISKVIPLGKTKGLGYDIKSVVAEDGDFAEHEKYIEVKTTKRVTPLNINDNNWLDTINITRNEWLAAQQYKEFYSIYRVYFTRDSVVVYALDNVYKKDEDDNIQVVPTTYRITFSNKAVDKVLK